MKKSPSKIKSRTRGGKRAGRRTLCTSDLQKLFCEALTKYHTIKDACAATGIGESTFFLWLAKGMIGEEPYVEFLELVQLARARVRVSLADEISTDRDWRAKAWYLERTWPQAFGPVAHRVLIREVPEQPIPPAQIEVRYENETPSSPSP